MKFILIDTETTGLCGYPDDLVLDIGAVIVNLDRKTVEPFYSSVLGYHVDSWPKRLRDSWIFSNSDLTLEMIRAAPDWYDVVREFSEKLFLTGLPVTSFNVAYDFGKFLNYAPWNLRYYPKLPCVMLAAAEYLKIPGPYGDYKWPRLEEIYAELCPDDPAGISEGQDHRALSDAVAAGYVAIGLHEKGFFVNPVAETDTVNSPEEACP